MIRTYITLEETLNLFYYPNLGNYKEEVEVSNGRYGPYIRHGAAFVSLLKAKIH
jgi:DNA topoisomerase-1